MIVETQSITNRKRWGETEAYKPYSQYLHWLLILHNLSLPPSRTKTISTDQKKCITVQTTMPMLIIKTGLTPLLNPIKIIVLLTALQPGIASAADGLSFYINATEGGDISALRISHLKSYFKQQQCNIETIETGNQSAAASGFDIIFMPLKQKMSKSYKKILGLKVIDKQVLSGSILVRASTAIRDIKNLAGVRMAFLSPHSITGFGLQKTLFDSAGITLQKDRITYTQTNIGAMSLLLHRDVFAAAVATPLAKKWAKANKLNIVIESKSVETGGIWINNSIAKDYQTLCQQSFLDLFQHKRERKIKKLVRIFPAWIDSFNRKNN